MSEDTQRSKVRINLSLDSSLIEQADLLAKKERRSSSNFIEVLIEREQARLELSTEEIAA